MSRPLHLLGLSSFALALVSNVTACHDSDGKSAGHAGASNEAGASSVAGASNEAGTAGSEEAAGAGGSAGEGEEAGLGGEAGAAGAPSKCEPGGALFVPGNYADSTRTLLLRTSPTAATIALVPKGAATSTKLPQLFLVERSCAASSALIARDESAFYRVELTQQASRLEICFVQAASFDAAVDLAPGCGGSIVQTFTQEAL